MLIPMVIRMKNGTDDAWYNGYRRRIVITVKSAASVFEVNFWNNLSTDEEEVKRNVKGRDLETLNAVT